MTSKTNASTPVDETPCIPVPAAPDLAFPLPEFPAPAFPPPTGPVLIPCGPVIVGVGVACATTLVGVVVCELDSPSGVDLADPITTEDANDAAALRLVLDVINAPPPVSVTPPGPVHTFPIGQHPYSPFEPRIQ
jgi:hypothetical protein